MAVYIALVHFPVMDKNKAVVTSSVTNFDIHDISRVARTYGAECFYIVTPLDSQEWFVKRIMFHWREGAGAEYNTTRRDAIERCSLVKDLGEAADAIEAQTGRTPRFVATSARRYPNTISFPDMREEIEKGEEDFCIVFGTGWGLHPTLMEEMDLILEPIEGTGDYNHLSVRCAVAVIMDRLMGKR